MVGKEVKEVYMGAALLFRDEARRRAPVRSGRLRRAIFADFGDPVKPNVIVGVQYFLHGKRQIAMAPHAHLVEFGTRNSPARPFMRPAVTASKDRMSNAIASGLRGILARHTL